MLGIDLQKHPWIQIQYYTKVKTLFWLTRACIKDLLGKLIHLPRTKPDVAYFVSQYMNNLNEHHLGAINKILRYLKGTLGHGLLFKKLSNSMVELYLLGTRELTDRRSTTDYCSYVWDNLVSWRWKKQAIVARNSVKAEYRVLVLGIHEGIWIQKLLTELKIDTQNLVKMFCDNQTTIDIAINPVHHDRTKHIEIDCHLISKKVNSNTVEFELCSILPTNN